MASGERALGERGERAAERGIEERKEAEQERRRQ